MIISFIPLLPADILLQSDIVLSREQLLLHLIFNSCYLIFLRFLNMKILIIMRLDHKALEA